MTAPGSILDRIARRIYMFNTGSLVESGSHEDLLFRMPAEKYRLTE